jgi:hypothetical protein
VNIHISLTRAAFSCLANKVPIDSLLSRIFQPLDDNGLGGAVTSAGAEDVVIHCSREEAEQLVDLAKKHCADAVVPISQALLDPV